MHSSCGAAVGGQALQLLGQHSCMSCLYEAQYAVLPAHLRKKRKALHVCSQLQADSKQTTAQMMCNRICKRYALFSEIRKRKPLPPKTIKCGPLRCKPLQQTISGRVRVAAAPARFGLQALAVVLARLFNSRCLCRRRHDCLRRRRWECNCVDRHGVLTGIPSCHGSPVMYICGTSVGRVVGAYVDGTIVHCTVAVRGGGDGNITALSGEDGSFVGVGL